MKTVLELIKTTDIQKVLTEVCYQKKQVQDGYELYLALCLRSEGKEGVVLTGYDYHANRFLGVQLKHDISQSYRETIDVLKCLQDGKMLLLPENKQLDSFLVICEIFRAAIDGWKEIIPRPVIPDSEEYRIYTLKTQEEVDQENRTRALYLEWAFRQVSKNQYVDQTAVFYETRFGTRLHWADFLDLEVGFRPSGLNGLMEKMLNDAVDKLECKYGYLPPNAFYKVVNEKDFLEKEYHRLRYSDFQFVLQRNYRIIIEPTCSDFHRIYVLNNQGEKKSLDQAFWKDENLILCDIIDCLTGDKTDPFDLIVEILFQLSFPALTKRLQKTDLARRLFGCLELRKKSLESEI